MYYPPNYVPYIVAGTEEFNIPTQSFTNTLFSRQIYGGSPAMNKRISNSLWISILGKEDDETMTELRKCPCVCNVPGTNWCMAWPHKTGWGILEMEVGFLYFAPYKAPCSIDFLQKIKVENWEKKDKIIKKLLKTKKYSKKGMWPRVGPMEDKGIILCRTKKCKGGVCGCKKRKCTGSERCERKLNKLAMILTSNDSDVTLWGRSDWIVRKNAVFYREPADDYIDIV